MVSRNFVDRLKAKLGRHYKFLKPLLTVVLGRSLEGRSTAFILHSLKKEPRKFFKAKVYTLSSFVNKVRAAPDKELQKDHLRELLETFPLLLLNIRLTGEKWYIGKIEDHPFDIFMAPERLVKVSGKNVDIYRGLHIQTKRLYQYPPQRMSLEEWVAFLGVTFEEKIAHVDFGFNGHIHFYNCVPLNESVDPEKLKVLLKKLHIPFNKYVDSISVSMELVSSTGDTTIATWYLYPKVYDFVGVLDLDFDKAKKLYMETDIAQMMIGALKNKVIIGNQQR